MDSFVEAGVEAVVHRTPGEVDALEPPRLVIRLRIRAGAMAGVRVRVKVRVKVSSRGDAPVTRSSARTCRRWHAVRRTRAES